MATLLFFGGIFTKKYGLEQNISAQIDQNTGKISLFRVREIVKTIDMVWQGACKHGVIQNHGPCPIPITSEEGIGGVGCFLNNRFET